MSQPPIAVPTDVWDACDGKSSPCHAFGPSLILAATVLIAGLVVAVSARSSALEAGRADDIRRVLDTATVLCALGVFALAGAAWRQTGDGAARWAGTGALMIAVAAATRPELGEALFGRPASVDSLATAASTAGSAVAPLVFAAGLVCRRPRAGSFGLALGALGLLAMVALVVYAAPGAVPRLGTVAGGDRRGGLVAGAVLGLAWLVLAVGYTVRGLRRRWLPMTWSVPLLSGLALSALAPACLGTDTGPAAAAAAFETFGMAATALACYMEVIARYENRSRQLLESFVATEAAEVRERVRREAARVRRHDLVNAMTAVDGAAMILEQEFEQLSDADRAALAGVVGSGTARVRRLVSEDGGGRSVVSLAEAAAMAIRDAGSPSQVELDVMPDLAATGSPGETAAAVRELLGHTARRAPGSPVTVRGERDGEWAVLWVEGGGTSVKKVRARVIDLPGRRSAEAQDDMGLLVATELIRGQGGELSVKPAPGDGTWYRIRLPAAETHDEDDGVGTSD